MKKGERNKRDGQVLEQEHGDSRKDWGIRQETAKENENVKRLNKYTPRSIRCIEDLLELV